MIDPDTSHFCPSCGAAQKHTPRYPWHLCNACRDLASDQDGQRYKFANVGFSGGFQFARAEDDEWFDCLGVICLVRRRPVYVHEARFGGIVAEPIPDLPFRKHNVIDIRRGIPADLIESHQAQTRGGGPIRPPGKPSDH